MNSRKYLIAAFFCGTTILNSIGQSLPIQQEYATSIDRILDRSPKIEEARNSDRSEVLKLRSENRLSQPELEFEHLWPKHSGENRWSIGISQSFDFPTLYSQRSKQAGIVDELMQAERFARECELRYAVELELIDLAALNKRESIYAARRERLERIMQMVERAATAGELTVMELNRVKLDHARTILLLDDIEPERATIIENISALTGLESTDIQYLIPSTKSFPYLETEVEAPTAAELNQLPAMSSLRLAKDAAQQTEKIAKMSRLPGVSLGYRHAFEEGMHFNGFSVGITLPVYSDKSKRLAAEAESAALANATDSKRNEIMAAATARCIAANKLLRQIEILKAPLNDTANREVLIKAYKGGEMSLLEMLRELEPFDEAELELLDLRIRYQKAAAALSHKIFN